MSIDETLLTLSLELMADFDSTIDTSEGSSFRSQFLNPLLDRVGGSPLDGDLETFLTERLRTEVPNIDVSRNSGMRDLVVRSAVAILAPFRREISGVQLSQSLLNFEQMTVPEVNALLGNYFTEVVEGGKARGTVRMLFSTPRSLVVTPLTTYSTGGGLNFFPVTVQSINAPQMAFNQEGSLFFVDFLLEAESAGEEYNLEPGDLTGVTGLVGVVRVTNLAKFEGGLDSETKAEAIGRTQNSITIRNLITDRGARFVLPENFPQLDVLQVIGFSDDEMQRDVISGLADISDIPGGIAGNDDPGLGGPEVHIGGKTDIYAYQLVPDLDDLTIEDVTDKGVRVFAGSHGFTLAGPATNTFQDEFGFFDKRGIAGGDFLLLGTGTFEILTVNSDNLVVLTSTITAGLFEQAYEIVSQQEGFITIPLYDLVAEAEGAAVIDEDDDPVAPIPGSLNNEALETAGIPEKKLDNVGRENIDLAILRVTTVEQIDPLTLESSGITIPMLDPLLFFALEDFDGGDTGTSTGIIRVWFRDPTNAWVTEAGTLFTYQSVTTFKPVPEALGSSQLPVSTATSVTTQQIDLSDGNFTPAGLGLVDEGFRISILGGAAAGTYTVLSGDFNGTDTELLIRETLPAAIVGEDWQLHVGIAENNMPQDSVTGLYYFDLDIIAVLAGPTGDLSANSEFSATSLLSEGWSLESTKAVLSFSPRDLPYLLLTDFVNDDFLMADLGTAPAIKVNYQFSSDVVEVQAFADDEANRIVAEDVLIRHFLPTYVRMQVTERGLTADAAKTILVDFINNLDPMQGLEASDLVDALYSAGATHVQLPLTLVGLIQNVDRSWSVRTDQDTLGTDRVVHFIADEAFIEVTEES